MPYETMTHAGRKRQRWIPENAITVREKSGLAVVYVYQQKRFLVNGKEHFTQLEKAQQYAAGWFETSGVVLAIETTSITFAVGYAGAAAKSSFHYRFKSADAVEKHIREFFDNLRAHKKIVGDRRAESYKPHTFVPGDIITNSWGYDQTNVDWYRVTRTSDHYVWLQPISGRIVDGEGCAPMAGHSEPYVDTESADPSSWGFSDAKGKVTKHRASGSNVSMKFGCGSKWDGRPKYCSWYH